MHSKIVVVFVIALAVSFASARCPPPASIYPCACNSLFSTIDCWTITNLTDLKVKLSGKLDKDYSLSITVLKQEVIEAQPVSGLKIKKLTILRSAVEEIEENAFADLGDSLLELVIGGSKLNSIPASALGGLRKLQRLDIRNANVTSVLKSEIDQLSPSIRDIRLDNNPIENIERGAFADLYKLRSLYLSQLKLSDLPDIWIPVHLTYLDLSANKFTSVPIKSLRSLEALSVNLQNNKIASIPAEDDLKSFLSEGSILNLNFNPLQCTCSLKWIVEFKKVSKKNGLKGVCLGDKHRRLQSIGWLKASSFADC